MAVIDGDEWLTSLSGHLTSGKQYEYQYPLNGRLGGPNSQSKHFGNDKNLFPLMEFELWTVQPVLQSLYLLYYHGTVGKAVVST
jgi:hypothetical protein